MSSHPGSAGCAAPERIPAIAHQMRHCKADNNNSGSEATEAAAALAVCISVLQAAGALHFWCACAAHACCYSSSKPQERSAAITAAPSPNHSHLARGWLMMMWPPGRSKRHAAQSVSCWSYTCPKQELKITASAIPRAAGRSTMSPHHVRTWRFPLLWFRCIASNLTVAQLMHAHASVHHRLHISKGFSTAPLR